MAKAVKRPRSGAAPAGVAAQTAPKARWRALFRCLAVGAACAAAGAGAGSIWRWYTLPQRVNAALTAEPVLAGWPAEFIERLRAARRAASDRATALAGLAELGRLHHANGFTAQAAACWRVLRSEEPKNARWAHLLADADRSASDYEGMESSLREVTRLAPDYAPAWLHLANHLLKSGRSEEAERAYRRRLALVPGDAYARLGLGRVALQRLRTAEARSWVAGIVQDHPCFASAHNLLAELLASEGEEAAAERQRHLGRTATAYADAEDPWLDELVAWCYDVERLRTLATIQFHARRGDRGVGLLERAVQIDPDNLQLRAALGDLFLKLGDAARARSALEACLSLASGRPLPIMAFVNLSHAYRRLGEPEFALAAARRGLADHPDAFELHDELGIVHAELGRLSEAVDWFSRAVQARPGDANANCNLALALLKLGRTAEAREALERSLSLQPTFPQSLAMLAQLDLQEGRWREAESRARTLVSTTPEHPAGRSLLAVCMLVGGREAEQRGEIEQAQRLYRDGLAADPQNAELRRRAEALSAAREHQGESEATPR